MAPAWLRRVKRPVVPMLFRHGVASGDPLADRVIIWTRVTIACRHDASVRWRVGTDEKLSRVIASGTVETSALRD